MIEDKRPVKVMLKRKNKSAPTSEKGYRVNFEKNSFGATAKINNKEFQYLAV